MNTTIDRNPTIKISSMLKDSQQARERQQSYSFNPEPTLMKLLERLEASITAEKPTDNPTFTSFFLQPIDQQYDQVWGAKTITTNKANDADDKEKLNVSSALSDEIDRKFTGITDCDNASSCELTPSATPSSDFFSKKNANPLISVFTLNKANKKITKLLIESWREKINCFKYKVFKSLFLLAVAELQASPKMISRIFLANLLRNSPLVEEELLANITVKLPSQKTQ